MPPVTELTELLGAPMSWLELCLRLLINLSAAFVLVRLIYYPLHRHKDYLFTFLLLNILIFLLCALLGAARLPMGFAFGLFAVFSMMRYRTVTIPVKEMGYFFVCIAIGVINALVSTEGFYVLLWGSSLLLLLLVLLLDRYVVLTHENRKEIIYERIELIRPDRRKEMMDDLIARTGLPVHRAEVVNINFLRDVATVHIFYYAQEVESSKAGIENIMKDDFK